MKFAASQTVINAPFPVKQFGHISQVTELSEYHDDLHARLLYLEDESTAWLSISADNIEMEIDVQKKIEKELVAFFDKPLHVTLSCTHSHHCCDPENPIYVQFFIDKVVQCAKEMHIKEMGNLTISYTTAYFDGVGKSRISHHEADSLQVDLFQIKQEEKELANIIIHNVHPTILFSTTPYFSAEYPGYLLQRLNETEPNVFHTFLNGAAGDTSTRFTRTCQTYASVERLGEKLFNKVMELKKEEKTSVPLQLAYVSEIIPLNHQFHPIDMSKMPSNLSAREIETIGYGQIMRQRLKDSPEALKKEVLLSCMDFGGPRIVFAPNEMFSWYRTQVDDSFCALVCYSNGHAPYITGPGQYLLTYETFTDTLTDESKLRIISFLQRYGQKQEKNQ